LHWPDHALEDAELVAIEAAKDVELAERELGEVARRLRRRQQLALAIFQRLVAMLEDALLDPELEAQLTAELEASLAAIMAIPVPFDQAFLGADTAPGRQAISAAIDALFAQTDSIAAAAEALGLDISTTL
jgi:uncharacterized iron-regulated protein